MERIKIKLTIEERDLIISHTFADDFLTQRLRDAETNEKQIKVTFTLEELDDLAGFIAAEANHSEDKKLVKKLDDLYDKISEIEDKYL